MNELSFEEKGIFSRFTTFWPACFDLVNTLYIHTMNKDYMLLIIFESILKGIASECKCGKYAPIHKGKDSEIWQIFIENVNKDQLYVWM